MSYTSAQYEDRIIRLETEVEQLRMVIKEKSELQHSLEHKDSTLLEKVRLFFLRLRGSFYPKSCL